MSFFYNSKIFPFSHQRVTHRSFMRLLHRATSSTIYLYHQNSFVQEIQESSLSISECSRSLVSRNWVNCVRRSVPQLWILWSTKHRKRPAFATSDKSSNGRHFLMSYENSSHDLGIAVYTSTSPDRRLVYYSRDF